MTLFLSDLLFCCCTASAAPLPEDFHSAILEFNTAAEYPIPHLTEQQITNLQRGKVITQIERRPTHPDRAMGILLIERDIDINTLWAAYRDLHFKQQKSTTEFLLYRQGVDLETWYGYMNLPWPVTDRHWVVTSWSNHKLAQKSKNKYWERSWKRNEVSPDQLVTHLADISLPSFIDPQSAIYTPVNEGAWAMLTIADQVLLVYHATTVIGGNIPDNVVAQFVVHTIDEMLIDIRDRAQNHIKVHYRAPHTTIFGGDGRPIAPF